LLIYFDEKMKFFYCQLFYPKMPNDEETYQICLAALEHVPKEVLYSFMKK
jgi:hypothetical protein